MKTQTVDVPEDLLLLLRQSRLGTQPLAEQVKIALAIHLFQEGVVSIGKAAELAGKPRVEFEWLLIEMGIPTVRYDRDSYELDRRALEEAERRNPNL